jgi:hypothetical protein
MGRCGFIGFSIAGRVLTWMRRPLRTCVSLLLAQSRYSSAADECRLLGERRTSRGHTVTQSTRVFHQKHGHVSRMACITPICALALHFSMCWFAHSLKASTIASFDTNDFGHAEGIDIVIESEGCLMPFNASPFVKTCRATRETNSKQKISPKLPPLHCLYSSWTSHCL